MTISTQGLALYHFESCPYCQKVRRAVAELGLDLELRDIRKNPDFQDEKVAATGKTQVPCLRIEKSDGVTWLYESDAVVDYLKAL
ncbi:MULTISPECIES: glutathione S-transferase N-terminal domain-containing protein [Vibrio]|uniref:Glutaredoxin n=1 Tax=Vibrio algicola TaxID=2662262 RepID=A0A5Q0THL7_9VIBR|nr:MULTISPECIES: glutathione S-transferase N-terminal domain-containing protein [Vibrio]MBD1577236.1 glutaredoxin [Vibrio sp. S11_S32]